MLLKDYYTIEKSLPIEGGGLFHIRLNKECDVYRGHFPESPVSPGVCNIQMIKECASQIVGRPLTICNLQQCRLTTLITPNEHPTMEARVLIETKDETYKLRATLGIGDETFLEMKAELN